MPKFQVDPYQVIEKKGSMVITKRGVMKSRTETAVTSNLSK